MQHHRSSSSSSWVTWASVAAYAYSFIAFGLQVGPFASGVGLIWWLSAMQMMDT
jgi:hypothetical protein